MVDFLRFCESCSGIDGGDINGKYWFVGMEWANWGEGSLKKYYDDGEWKEVKEPEYPKGIESIAKEEWKFERKLNKLYQAICDENKNRQIFSASSNSFKLNLFPLPFENDEDNRKKQKWDENEPYRKMTGFGSFEEYQEGVIEARRKCFDRLLQTGKRPKTVFCFGTGYKKYFGQTFNIPWTELKLFEERITYKRRIFKADHPREEIEQLLICPFPYFESDYVDEDIEKIIKCLKS